GVSGSRRWLNALHIVSLFYTKNDLFKIYRACFRFLLFNDPATTEIYTLSLHDALPICSGRWMGEIDAQREDVLPASLQTGAEARSEEHTSELQSRGHLVCRLLLEKKKLSRFTFAAYSIRRSTWSAKRGTDG